MTPHRYIEDFRVGESFATACHTVNEAEALAFAGLHDPQPFHVDQNEARGHPIFRGLALSGFHTMAITHRLILDCKLGHAWGLIGKGIRRLRWNRPVRPGDTLHAWGQVLSVHHDPGRTAGTMDVEIVTLNQKREAVMTFAVTLVVPSRVVAQGEVARAA